MVSSSNGSDPPRTAFTLLGSIVLVHEPTSIVAPALPEKFVTARASDMNRFDPDDDQADAVE
jgi:hypothetical protein